VAKSGELIEHVSQKISVDGHGAENNLLDRRCAAVTQDPRLVTRRSIAAFGDPWL